MDDDEFNINKYYADMATGRIHPHSAGDEKKPGVMDLAGPQVELLTGSGLRTGTHSEVWIGGYQMQNLHHFDYRVRYNADGVVMTEIRLVIAGDDVVKVVRRED